MRNQQAKPVQKLDKNERSTLSAAIDVLSNDFNELPNPLVATLNTILDWRNEDQYPPERTIDSMLAVLALLEDQPPAWARSHHYLYQWIKVFIIRHVQHLLLKKDYNLLYEC